MLTGRWQWIAFLLAPLSLLLGVSYQRYNVELHNQSAWAGGGFGMFSTVDIPDGRARRAYVLTDQGRALIANDKVISRQIYTRPRPELLEEIAQGLAARRWVVYGPESYRALQPAFPDYLQAHFRSTPAWALFLSDSTMDVASVHGLYPERLAFDARRTPTVGAPREVETVGVRAEVWKPVFYSDRNVIQWELLSEGSATIPPR